MIEQGKTVLLLVTYGYYNGRNVPMKCAQCAAKSKDQYLYNSLFMAIEVSAFRSYINDNNDTLHKKYRHLKH